MPIAYHIDPGRRLVRVTLAGELTRSDFADYRARLEAEPGFDATFDRLIDARGAGTLPTAAQVRQVAQTRLREEAGRDSRRAVVADRPVAYGLMRMLEICAEGAPAKYRAFQSMEAAREWLGLPAGDEAGAEVPRPHHLDAARRTRSQ